EEADGLAFVGLGDERDAAIGREAVDAAVLIGGEENLLLEREDVIDVFVLGGPEGFDGVVGVDAVDGALIDSRGFGERAQGGGDLRGGGGSGGLLDLRLSRIGRLDLGGGAAFDGDGSADGRNAVRADAGGGAVLVGGLRAFGDAAPERGGVDGAI